HPPTAVIYPLSLHDALPIFLRWATRVQAYVLALTDEFPPFSLSADREAGRNAAVKSAAVGLVVIGGVAGALVAFVTFGGQQITRDRKSTRLNSSHDQISYAV